jgi:hypothetical protein
MLAVIKLILVLNLADIQRIGKKSVQRILGKWIAFP